MAAADNEILMVVYTALQDRLDLEELCPLLFDVVLGVVRRLIEVRQSIGSVPPNIEKSGLQ